MKANTHKEKSLTVKLRNQYYVPLTEWLKQTNSHRKQQQKNGNENNVDNNHTNRQYCLRAIFVFILALGVLQIPT